MDLTEKIRARLLKEKEALIEIKNLSILLEWYCRKNKIESSELPDYFNSVISFILDNTRIFLAGCDGKKAFPSEQSVRRFKKKNRKKHTDETKWYLCNFCNKYHLTSYLREKQGSRYLIIKQ